jgi:hypothetical protein
MNEVHRAEVETHAWIGDDQNLSGAWAELTRQDCPLNVATR